MEDQSEEYTHQHAIHSVVGEDLEGEVLKAVPSSSEVSQFLKRPLDHLVAPPVDNFLLRASKDLRVNGRWRCEGLEGESAAG